MILSGWEELNLCNEGGSQCLLGESVQRIRQGSAVLELLRRSLLDLLAGNDLRNRHVLEGLQRASQVVSEVADIVECRGQIAELIEAIVDS